MPAVKYYYEEDDYEIEHCQATLYSGNGCDCDRCQDGKLPEASPVWDEREDQTPEQE